MGAGLALGLSAGFSPGPLLTLVLSQTLRHGFREGAKIAATPLLTDIPIILATTFLITSVANVRLLLGLISLVGGLFVIYLAWETFRTEQVQVTIQEESPRSLLKGAMVNALSPHPYLFWITVGAPTIVRGWQIAPLAAFLFIGSFLGSLVGAKLLMAFVVGKSKELLQGRTYRLIMRFLAMLLLLFALLLIREGASMLSTDKPGLTAVMTPSILSQPLPPGRQRLIQTENR